MAIEIIPAIDIIGGECVRLSQGDYDQMTKYSSSPVDIAKSFEDCGVTRLHLVDLDGAKCSMPQNLKVLETIATKTSMKIEFGGGIKNRSAVEAVFNSGGNWAICGSIAVTNPEEFSSWLEEFGGDKIILGADVRNGMVSTHGWLKDSTLSLNQLIDSFKKYNLKEVITTDISCDGMLTGPSFDLYKGLAVDYPEIDVIVSGGISGMKDIEQLSEMGMKKVIVGKAIYENRITLEDITKWLQRG